jgi:hypothetical protein
MLFVSIVVTVLAIYSGSKRGLSSCEWLGDCMSYFVMPPLILITAISWVIVFGTCFGTILSSDVCTDPDATIQNMLKIADLDSTTFQLVSSYTTG